MLEQQTKVTNKGVRDLDSLHVWQIFAQSEIGKLRAVRNHCKRVSSLDKIIQQAYHPTCAWVTTLDILIGDVSSVDLVRVSELQNLRRFHMATNHGSTAERGFNDRVLKTWAEQAQEKGAFACLRSMTLYRQAGVTKWSLDRLTAFPALEEFCAYRCKISLRCTASLLGWRNTSR
jgi:hypothetical protein